MPWRPLLEICREFERLPVRLNPAATKELKLFFANRLNLAVGQVSDDDISTVTKFATLQSPEVVMVHAAREMKWLASGRRSADGNREVIHPDRWAFLTLDIEHQAVRDLNGNVVYADLKGAFGNDLTEKEWQEVELGLTPPKPTTRVGHEYREPVEVAVPEESGEEKKPRARRNRDVETVVKLENRIKMILAAAKAEWPIKNKRPGLRAMAKHLESTHGKKLGFKFEAIRQILRGSYPASKDLDIPGF